MSTVDLNEKLRAFANVRGVTAKSPAGVVLPRAFITTTTAQVGPIPAGDQCIAEPNVMGLFALTWWDSKGSSHKATAKAEDIDIDAVYADARATLLAEISTLDLEAELARRRAADGSEVTV